MSTPGQVAQSLAALGLIETYWWYRNNNPQIAPIIAAYAASKGPNTPSKRIRYNSDYPTPGASQPTIDEVQETSVPENNSEMPPTTRSRGLSNASRMSTGSVKSNTFQKSQYGTGTYRSTKKFTKAKKSKFTGIHHQYEQGGQIVEAQSSGATISQALYVGHTTANAQRQQLVFWAAALKLLLKKAGYSVADQKAAINDVKVHIVYEETSNSAQQTYDTGINISLYTAAVSLRDKFDDVDNDTYVFKHIELRKSTNNTVLASMSMDKLLIDYYVCSKLKLQNITQTTDSTDSTDTSDQNPLKCKVYHINQAFVNNDGSPNQTGALTVQNGKGYPNVDSRVQFFNQDLAGDEIDYFRNLPKGNGFTAFKYATKSYMQPGAIINDCVVYKKTIYFNTLFNQTLRQVTGGQNKYGKLNLIGMTKLIDNRGELNAPSVNWEHQMDFYATAKLHLPKWSLPVRDITTGTYPGGPT